MIFQMGQMSQMYRTEEDKLQFNPVSRSWATKMQLSYDSVRFGHSCLRSAVRKLRLFDAPAVVGAFVFCVSTVFAQSPQKLWSVDLGTNKDFHNRLDVFEGAVNPPSIDFLSNSRIICGFYDGERRNINSPPLPRPGYHVLAINAQNGLFGQELDFHPAEDDAKTLPIYGGGFVVSTGRELLEFSNEFVPGIKYQEPSGDLDAYLRVDVSPSLQTILVYDKTPENPQAEWNWFRVKDFSLVTGLQGPRARLKWEASDTAAIFDGIGNRTLLSTGKVAVICTLCNAYFITDDLLFIDMDTSYYLQTIEGKQQGRGKLNLEALKLTRAAQATRIAYLTGAYRGWGFPIQTHFNRLTGKVIVLDWSTNKKVGEIKISERVSNPSAGFEQTALALSPDGKYVAFLFHHTLSLYRMP